MSHLLIEIMDGLTSPTRAGKEVDDLVGMKMRMHHSPRRTGLPTPD